MTTRKREQQRLRSRQIGTYLFHEMRKAAIQKPGLTGEETFGRIAMFETRHIASAKTLIARVLPDDAEEANQHFEGHPFSPTRECPMTYRFVYEFGDLMAGVCGIYRLETFPADVCGLCWFGVDPLFQRHGIGSELLEFAEALARKNHYRLMIIWAEESAVSFYHKHGYRTRAETVGPEEEGIFMFKHLVKPDETLT